MDAAAADCELTETRGYCRSRSANVCKGEMVNVLGFRGRMISFTVPWLLSSQCQLSHRQLRNKPGCVPMPSFFFILKCYLFSYSLLSPPLHICISVCMNICSCVQMPVEARGECWIPWLQSYRCLQMVQRGCWDPNPGSYD